MSSFSIEQHEAEGRGLFYVGKDRKAPQAAMMYHRWGDMQNVNIDHTEVDDSLRGEGAGEQLLKALVAWARHVGLKVSATCPFAVAMLKRHTELQDVVVEYVDERRR